MPFDYMHSKIPQSYRDVGEKAEAQYLKELRERAALLRRLGYEEVDAAKRLIGNLNWDWECNPKPDFVERIRGAIPEIVREIFSKAPAPEKGRRITYQDLKTLPSD